MIRLAIIAWLALCGVANAQLSGGLQFPGPGTAHSAGSGYTGPLDVSGLSTNVLACYSLRACSSALRGTKAVEACNSTGGVDVGCGDLLTDAVTGSLVAATISGITCPGANCTIRTWYDQTASGGCGGSCDSLQSVVAQRATLPSGILGSFAVGRMATTQGSSNGATFTAADPTTLSSVSRRVTNTGLDIMFGGGGATPSLYFDGTNGTVGMFNGGTVTIGTGATENAWHVIAGMFNGASSVGRVDGVSSGTVNPGNSGIGGSTLNINNGSFDTNFDTVENIMWTADKSSSLAALCTNQFSYWGTSVSC